MSVGIVSGGEEFMSDILKNELGANFEEDRAIDLSSENQKTKVDFCEKTKNEEVKNITLQPEQIEEINADEYSLVIFYATRVEPLSLSEIKKYIPEPESKKAQSVLNRFLECGLVHITSEGKYYSNYPDHYIDYSKYRYDEMLEIRKERRIFNLMKENFENKEYWKNKSYFSLDGFFTEKQSKEIAEDLNKIRLKVKKYSSENTKSKKIVDLIFRRFKFYDMIFNVVTALIFFVLASGNIAYAGGGNDPGAIIADYIPPRYDVDQLNQIFNINPISPEEIVDQLNFRRSLQITASGGGNDPGIPQDQAFINQVMGNGGFSAMVPTYQGWGVKYNSNIALEKYSMGTVSAYQGNKINEETCGYLLYQAKGSLLGLNPQCLNAVSHALKAECQESGHNEYCNGVRATNRLIKFFE